MILIGILTTLCSSSRHDFLIFNQKMGASGECELWKNGMQVMKDFYCKPGIKVNKRALIQQRDIWFGRNRWWYDPQRGVPRNTQNPGNYTLQYQRPNHLEETLKWKTIVGLRGSGALKLTAAEQPPRPPNSRSKTKKPTTSSRSSGRPDRTKSKEQREENIRELNKWGLGSVKCKAAAVPPKKSSSSSTADTTLKRKRDTPVIIEKVKAPYRVHADPPQKSHQLEPHDWNRADQQHKAALLTIRRNAELEEARIEEDKRLKVLREEAEQEAQRSKRLRQAEEKGIDLV